MWDWLTPLSQAVVLIGLAQAPLYAQGEPQSPNAAPIRLQSGSFAPGLGEAPDVPPGLKIAEYAAGSRGYYIVQFAGPVGDQARVEIEALGGDVLGYIPDHAFKVRMAPGQARRLEDLDSVSWVGLFHPAYKLSAKLKRNGERLYRVKVENGGANEVVKDELDAIGATVVSEGGNVLVISAGSEQLDAVARILDVGSIGMKLETMENLPLGRQATFELVARSRRLRIPGRVAWCRLVRTVKTAAGDQVPVYRAGVRFAESFSAGTRDELLEIIRTHRQVA